MGSVTIRNLDNRVKEKIRLRAAKNGHSMEEEARRLLTRAVDIPANEETGLGTANSTPPCASSPHQARTAAARAHAQAVKIRLMIILDFRRQQWEA